jgi:hypothetical protein
MEGETTLYWGKGNSDKSCGSIFVYAMSVFLIPKKVCKMITDIIAQFWWGDNDQSKKKCIGIHGGKCASQRRKGVWVFETYTLSI